MSKTKLVAQLDGDKAIVTDKSTIDILIQKGYGERYENYLVLDVYETIYLMENRNMTILLKMEDLPKNAVIKKVLETTKNNFLMHKFHVYKEIRDKGYIIKTGLKFGFDFRVYPLGKKIDDAHTQFVLDVCPQDIALRTEVIARNVRMAQGLHAKYVLAIVDNELEITYYNVDREKF